MVVDAVSMLVLAITDEADELSLTMFTTAKSRKGRRNTNEQPSTPLSPNSLLNDVEHSSRCICVGSTAETASMSHCHRILRGRVWICLIHGNAIRHRCAMMTNPTCRSSGTKNNWEYQDESSTIFRSSIFAKAIVKSYEPDDARRPATTWRVMALTVAWQQIGRTPDTD